MRMLRRLLAAAVLAGLATTQAVAAEPPLAVGYVTKSATNQGWLIINAGAAAAARDAGVRLIVAGPSTQGALAGQIEAIERVVAQGVKAVAVAPVDSAGITPVVQRLGAKGIPFIAVDTAIDGNLAKSYVATDNLAAAAAQAEWVAGQIGDADQIILVDGSLAQSTGRERRQGFLDRLRQLKPHAVVIEVPTHWTLDEAQTGVAAALRAHPKATLIANAWDDGTLGSVAALRAAHDARGRIRVIGFDGAPNALALLREGWIQADVAQMLYREGYDGVKAAVAAAKGEAVPQRIDTGHALVTGDNLDQFVTQNKLGQFMD
jgi:ABC-type sugar transport system substrate-binding protein